MNDFAALKSDDDVENVGTRLLVNWWVVSKACSVRRKQFWSLGATMAFWHDLTRDYTLPCPSGDSSGQENVRILLRTTMPSSNRPNWSKFLLKTRILARIVGCSSRSFMVNPAVVEVHERVVRVEILQCDIVGHHRNRWRLKKKPIWP